MISLTAGQGVLVNSRDIPPVRLRPIRSVGAGAAAPRSIEASASISSAI